MKISSRCCILLAATASFTSAFTLQQPLKTSPVNKASGTRNSSNLFSISYEQAYANLAPAAPMPVNGAVGAVVEPAPMSTKRRPIVAGNWKLNPTSKTEAMDLLNGLKAANQGAGEGDVEVVVFPPLTFLSDAVEMLKGTGIKVGAQNASSFEKGAYTGEIAPSMLASAGCSYVLLGHSERRSLFGESDSSINERMHACLKEQDLKVVLCIGETLNEYEAGLLNSVVDTQLRKGLAGVDAKDLLDGRVVIAYEPVWAIGTGLVATPEQAQAAHVAVRTTLASMYAEDPSVATSMRIQYGGSVSPDSVEDLMAMPDVDGALVGGASLLADSFTQIVAGSAPAGSVPAPAALSTNYLPSVESAAKLASAPAAATPSAPLEGSVFTHAPISHFTLDQLTSKGPRKGADVGSPHDSTKPLVSVGGTSAGSWWCAEGGWPSPTPRATTEIFYVLEGRACVTSMNGTRHFFGPGDLVILPKGWNGRWDVLEDIHKIWVVTDHPDTVGHSTEAIIKPYSNFAPHFLASNGVRADANHGAPTTASDTYFNNGHVSVGAWTCTPGSWPVSERTTTEAFMVLEGVFFLTNKDGSARRCVAGDTVVLPKGWSGQWDVIETVKKVWVDSHL